jgi:hypothetical protein
MKGLGGKVLGGAMNGAMAYGGIKLGASMLGMDQGLPGAGTDALAVGAGVGLMTAPVLGPAAIIPAVAAGAAKFLMTLNAQLTEAEDAFKKGQKDLEDLNKKYPEAAHMTQLRNKLDKIKAQLYTEERRTPNADDPFAQMKQNANVQYLQGRQAAIEAEMAQTTKEGQKAKRNPFAFLSDTSKTDLEKNITSAENILKQVQLGHGPLRDKQKAYWEFAVAAAKIRKDIQTLDLRITDSDLKAKQDELVKARAALDAYAKSVGPGASKDVKAKIDAQSNKLDEAEKLLYQKQGSRYIEERRGDMKDTWKKIDSQKQEILSGLDTSIAGQMKSGLLKIQKEMEEKKDILGADFPAALKKAQDAFRNTFNMPLKKLQNELANLQLGGSGQNEVQALKIGLGIKNAQIDERVKAHQMTPEQAARFKKQNQQGLDDQLQQKSIEDQMANLQLGDETMSSEELRKLGLAELKNKINQRVHEGKMSAVLGAQMLREKTAASDQEAAYKRQTMPLEMERIDYQKQMLPLQSQQRVLDVGLQKTLQPIQFQQQTLGLQDTMRAGRTADWNLTATDQRLQEKAEQEARRTVAAERGPISYAEREAEAEESLRSQIEQAKLAGDAAEASLAVLQEKNRIETAANDIQNRLNAVNENILALELDKKAADWVKAMEGATTKQNATGRAAVGAANEKLHEAVSGGKASVDMNDGTEYGVTPGKNKSSAPTIPITVQEGAKVTYKDIDIWIPQIREALCKLATSSGARG